MHLNALIGEGEGSVASLHDPGREKQHIIPVDSRVLTWQHQNRPKHNFGCAFQLVIDNC